MQCRSRPCPPRHRACLRVACHRRHRHLFRALRSSRRHRLPCAWTHRTHLAPSAPWAPWTSWVPWALLASCPWAQEEAPAPAERTQGRANLPRAPHPALASSIWCGTRARSPARRKAASSCPRPTSPLHMQCRTRQPRHSLSTHGCVESECVGVCDVRTLSTESTASLTR